MSISRPSVLPYSTCWFIVTRKQEWATKPDDDKCGGGFSNVWEVVYSASLTQIAYPLRFVQTMLNTQFHKVPVQQ